MVENRDKGGFKWSVASFRKTQIVLNRTVFDSRRENWGKYQWFYYTGCPNSTEKFIPKYWRFLN